MDFVTTLKVHVFNTPLKKYESIPTGDQFLAGVSSFRFTVSVWFVVLPIQTNIEG